MIKLNKKLFSFIFVFEVELRVEPILPPVLNDRLNSILAPRLNDIQKLFENLFIFDRKTNSQNIRFLQSAWQTFKLDSNLIFCLLLLFICRIVWVCFGRFSRLFPVFRIYPQRHFEFQEHGVSQFLSIYYLQIRIMKLKERFWMWCL